MYHIGICDDDTVFIEYMKRLFWSDTILRIICDSLSMLGVIIVAFFAEKFLLNAKKRTVRKE